MDPTNNEKLSRTQVKKGFAIMAGFRPARLLDRHPPEEGPVPPGIDLAPQQLLIAE